MERADFYALDSAGELIALLAPMEVQWNRKYYNVGDFSIQLPIGQYSSNIAYIYCNKRPEVGIVGKRQYKVDESGKSYVQISGYFYEYKLEDDIIYPAYSGGRDDHVDVAVSNMITQYKTGGFAIATPSGFGTPCDFAPELGKSLMDQSYDILQLHECSQRIQYDYDNNNFSYSVWKGRDLTSDNTDGNNPVIFSLAFKNLKNPDVLLDDTPYKNYAVVHYNWHDTDLFEIVDNRSAGEEMKKVYIDASIDSDDNLTESQIRAKMIDSGKTELNNSHSSTVNTSFNIVEGPYVYMQDFDLGDKISIVIDTIDYNEDVRIVAINEVFSPTGHTLNIEVGNKEVI